MTWRFWSTRYAEHVTDEIRYLRAELTAERQRHEQDVLDLREQVAHERGRAEEAINTRLMDKQMQPVIPAIPPPAEVRQFDARAQARLREQMAKLTANPEFSMAGDAFAEGVVDLP